MPRTSRAAVGGMVYHVLNRGNAGIGDIHRCSTVVDISGVKT
jgi:hypothetical protein